MVVEDLPKYISNNMSEVAKTAADISDSVKGSWLADKIKKYRTYIISIAIALGVGVLGGIITFLGMPRFSQLTQPPLSPPPFLFPIVWTVLYTLMGIGAARIYIKNDKRLSKELLIYAVQLFFNFFWTVFFFGFGAYLFSFIWIVALWGLVLAMIIGFYKKDKISGLIQIPYLLWLTFAAYLNLGIYLLNR